ncbi:MAG: 4a-hydroxytetrahydrobiopterin dehydratase [Phycisphaerae bacterium]|nr:4a-hydroxytetrahydrobiopterin dehydratase [Phycisphaerae bacterium]
MAKGAKKSGGGAAAGAAGRLDPQQIAAELALRPDWSDSGGAIQRTFAFKSFVESMAFVNKVAAAAEAMNHHPDILIRYNKVTMTLSTHDAGGITRKDFELAAKMDSMLA